MKSKSIITAILVLVFVFGLSACDIWGHGMFTKIEVTDIKMNGVWEYYGYYFANFSFEIENTGLVDVDHGYIKVKIFFQDGSSITDDIMFDYLAVGESTSGTGNIKIERTDIKDWKVVDVLRYAPVGTIGG